MPVLTDILSTTTCDNQVRASPDTPTIDNTIYLPTHLPAFEEIIRFFPRCVPFAFNSCVEKNLLTFAHCYRTPYTSQTLPLALRKQSINQSHKPPRVETNFYCTHQRLFMHFDQFPLHSSASPMCLLYEFILQQSISPMYFIVFHCPNQTLSICCTFLCPTSCACSFSALRALQYIQENASRRSKERYFCCLSVAPFESGANFEGRG